jgi:8-oxo-dGTP diphosphatase
MQAYRRDRGRGPAPLCSRRGSAGFPGRCTSAASPDGAPVTFVRAAGGLVVRDGRVLLVHRPKYDDWTFPKGKAEDGETDEECAVREVAEETGLRCALAEEAGATEYVDSKGRPKRVRWWVMHPRGGAFVPTDEVDELRWTTPADAARVLSYPHDVALLGRLRAV